MHGGLGAGDGERYLRLQLVVVEQVDDLSIGRVHVAVCGLDERSPPPVRDPPGERIAPEGRVRRLVEVPPDARCYRSFRGVQTPRLRHVHPDAQRLDVDRDLRHPDPPGLGRLLVDPHGGTPAPVRRRTRSDVVTR